MRAIRSTSLAMTALLAASLAAQSAPAYRVTVATATGHGFATSGNDGTVVMFDLRTYAPLARIPAAPDADAIVYDAASNRVFTLNGDAHSSTVIDPAAGRVTSTIPLGGKPEYGVAAGDGTVFANITDNSEVVAIDARALTVARRWSTAPCKQPVSMAIDTVHHRLFSGCRSGVTLPGSFGLLIVERSWLKHPRQTSRRRSR